jgi:hypothetical protein
LILPNLYHLTSSPQAAIPALITQNITFWIYTYFT